jgi:hypothetical protein
LRKGESPLLPGEEREKEEGKVGAGRVHQQREKEGFSFSGAFKIYTTLWEGRPRRFPPNNE